MTQNLGLNLFHAYQSAALGEAMVVFLQNYALFVCLVIYTKVYIETAKLNIFELFEPFSLLNWCPLFLPFIFLLQFLLFQHTTAVIILFTLSSGFLVKLDGNRFGKSAVFLKVSAYFAVLSEHLKWKSEIDVFDFEIVQQIMDVQLVSRGHGLIF